MAIAATDPKRTVPATAVPDIDADGVAPGSVEVRGGSDDFRGYAFTCPGCGSRSYLPLDAAGSHPRWSLEAGDFSRPETVSLSPSILHSPDRGGCGWHGYLKRGVFTSL